MLPKALITLVEGDTKYKRWRVITSNCKPALGNNRLSYNK